MADESNEKEVALDLSGLGSFDFTPDWAKGRSDDKSRSARYEDHCERTDERRETGVRRSFADE